MNSMTEPLTAAGVDFKNTAAAKKFLVKLLSGHAFREINTSIRTVYWYGIAIVIAIATAYNVYVKMLTWSRLRAAQLKKRSPTKSANIATKSMVTMMTILREASYLHFIPSRFSSRATPPALGASVLCLVYLGWVLGLQFFRVNYPGAQHYTSLGLRAAWMAVIQLPLLILLASKENLIGYLTGISYERLNVFHRWIARMVWLTATLHWAYLQYGWSQFGLNHLERTTDRAYSLGVVAWFLLTWINISSFAFLRNLHYEFFVCQHVIAWIGFIIVVLVHVPIVQARIYVYIAIGFFVFDRLFRSSRFLRCNYPLGRATITALPGNVSKITVHSSGLTSWRNGQHVFLSIPRFGWYQSHPATILSTPRSHQGDLVFILKAHQGFTARCLASTYFAMPLSPISKSASTDKSLTQVSSASETGETAMVPKRKYIALLGGPYGGSHADFAAFSSVLLVAGSTGVTYNLPILLDLAERAQEVALPVRRIMFVWVIKSSSWTVWIQEELQDAVDRMRLAGIRMEIQIFVTGENTTINSCSPITTTSTSNPTNCFMDQSEKRPCCGCHDPDIDCSCGGNGSESISTTTRGGKETIIRVDVADLLNPIQPILSSGTSTTAVADSDKEKNPTDSGSSPTPSLEQTTRAHSFATIRSGRPSIEVIIRDELAKAEGELGIGVCGPKGLSISCRQATANICRERRAVKGISEMPRIYLHVEGFGW